MTKIEELKPCPYHGDLSVMEFSSASNKFVACRKCDRENTTWYRPIEDWNNAWIWKELNALTDQVAEMQKDLVRYKKWLDESLALGQVHISRIKKLENVLECLISENDSDKLIYLQQMANEALKTTGTEENERLKGK